MNFTAHNIVLADGSETLPGRAPLEQTGHCQAILRSMALAFPGDRSAVRVADLGCLEGGYTVAIARAGYQVTGIEARAGNLERCYYVANRTRLAGMRFVEDDVRNLEAHGSFDCVLCAGLLYHLESPTSFICMLGRVTKRLLLLQTHYSVDLIDEHEGSLGHWYDEPAADQWAASWAAFRNYRSFWMSKKHILQTMRQAGFGCVYEQYDFLENIVTDKYIEENNRSLFIGVKCE